MVEVDRVYSPNGTVLHLKQSKKELFLSKRKVHFWDRISLSYHRNLSHRSFKLPIYLEYLFAYFGLHAVQGDPMFWVSVHRYHHQFVDTDRDPHSPIEGFWFSHINWVFQHNYLWEKCGKSNNVMDLKKQAYYRFLRRTHALHLLGLALLLYVAGGLPHLIWGMCETSSQPPWHIRGEFSLPYMGKKAMEHQRLV
ncbi:hypothetical protein MKW92_049859 [Papaver armeniacum]|nr:hypothetical protein MKW92_049859 [Papaver armeniacum]